MAVDVDLLVGEGVDQILVGGHARADRGKIDGAGHRVARRCQAVISLGRDVLHGAVRPADFGDDPGHLLRRRERFRQLDLRRTRSAARPRRDRPSRRGKVVQPNAILELAAAHLRLRDRLRIECGAHGDDAAPVVVHVDRHRRVDLASRQHHDERDEKNGQPSHDAVTLASQTPPRNSRACGRKPAHGRLPEKPGARRGERAKRVETLASERAAAAQVSCAADERASS